MPSLASITAWGSLLQGAGALGAAAVAIVAVYFTYRTTQDGMAAQRSQNEHTLATQERMNRSEVIWTQRIGAYEDALTWLTPILSELTGEHSDRSPVYPPDEFTRGQSVPSLLDAKLRLYASGPALIPLAHLREPVATTREAVEHLFTLETAIRDHVDRASERP
jgi:hypothetical protein